MKRPVRLLLLFAIALCAGCRLVEPAPPPSLCILHTSDIHGHILPQRVAGERHRIGGAAVLAGCVKKIREENARRGIPTLLLDAGDFYMGTPEGDSSGGQALVEVMNALGYDALAVGNHDWDGGVARLRGLAERAAFPFLGANVIVRETGQTPAFLRPHIVKDCGAVRVGVAGVTLEDSTPMPIPGTAASIVCLEPEEQLGNSVDALRRDRAGLVIVLSHLGLNGDKRLARKVEGVDLILGGHSHLALREPFRSPEHGTLILQPGSYGRYLGKLDLTLDPRSKRVARYDYALIPLTENRCAPDAAMEARVDRWRARAGNRFDEIVGWSESDFLKNREGVAMLGEMIADGMREATGAQIAFNQRHGIRGPLLEGEIRYRDVYAIIPFDDTLWTVRLTGKQVRGILERVLSFRRPDNLRFSGLTVDYDPSAPRNARLSAAACGETPLDDEEVYLVALNTYLVKWGFIRDLVAEGSALTDTGIIARDMLRDHIRAHSPVSAKRFAARRLVAVERTAGGGPRRAAARGAGRRADDHQPPRQDGREGALNVPGRN